MMRASKTARLALVGLLGTLVSSTALAQDTAFQAANQNAARGEYDQAIAAYVALIKAGVTDPNLHYNLGIAWGNQGDLPRAVWQFERVLRLDPSDTDARRQLERAEQALASARAEREGEATIRNKVPILRAVFGRASASMLSLLALLGEVVALCAFGWLLWRRSRRRWPGVVAGGLALAVMLTSLLGLRVQKQIEASQAAVVLEERVALRDGPDPRALSRGVARGGDRAQILQFEGDFALIQLNDGPQGWAPKSAVGPI